MPARRSMLPSPHEAHYQSYTPPLQHVPKTRHAHLWVDASAQNSNLDPRKVQDHFEDFYEDLFEELSKYGDIENLNICDNIADHMVGNVYVQFREDEHAANAVQNLTGRFYAGS